MYHFLILIFFFLLYFGINNALKCHMQWANKCEYSNHQPPDSILMLFPYVRHRKKPSLEIWKAQWFGARNTGIRSQRPLFSFQKLGQVIQPFWVQVLSSGKCKGSSLWVLMALIVPGFLKYSQEGATWLSSCRSSGLPFAVLTLGLT